jgi:ABC-2 type transport system permease protein
LVKKNEGLKIAILIAVSNIGSFLAGMMYVNMKYIIAKNLPLLSYLNPATLITDGFYSLYYYNTHQRFFVNISILAVLSIIFSLITYFIIRRQRYASL